MKKLLIGLLVLNVASVNASDVDEERMNYIKEQLSAQGMVMPDEGLKIISEYELDKDPILKQGRLDIRAQMKQKGYVTEKNSSLISKMFDMKKEISDELKKSKPKYIGLDTQIKSDVAAIKMAYTFVGVPNEVMSENLGYSPYLAYQKDGWTGAIQYFSDLNHNNCAFFENNIKLNRSSIAISEQDIEYKVNSKPSETYVSGNAGEGFLYSISWYDTTFFRKLECVSEKFSKALTNQFLGLANTIDSYQ